MSCRNSFSIPWRVCPALAQNLLKSLAQHHQYACPKCWEAERSRIIIFTRSKNICILISASTLNAWHIQSTAILLWLFDLSGCRGSKALLQKAHIIWHTEFYWTSIIKPQGSLSFSQKRRYRPQRCRNITS